MTREAIQIAESNPQHEQGRRRLTSKVFLVRKADECVGYIE